MRNDMKDKQDIKQNIERVPEGLGSMQPGRSSIYIKTALYLLLLILFAGIGYLFSKSNQNRKLALLEEENRLLRAKIELYGDTVDSIYSMLDSLGIKHDHKQNPELYRGGAATLTGHSRDPRLKQQMEKMEYTLVDILRSLSPQSPGIEVYGNEIEVIAKDTPSIYPTFGRITDHWGTRMHPITRNLEFHNGIDIANETGTPIYATASGVVASAGYQRGYGRRITIEHGNEYRSIYAHLYSIKVKEGDPVQKGQIIGLMGNSGLSTGPHLHYEVQYKGRSMNPARYLNRTERYASR
jgi:murein DD-endopeptidase MepM/ murein hydrolase activator NlpD